MLKRLIIPGGVLTQIQNANGIVSLSYVFCFVQAGERHKLLGPVKRTGQAPSWLAFWFSIQQGRRGMTSCASDSTFVLSNTPCTGMSVNAAPEWDPAWMQEYTHLTGTALNLFSWARRPWMSYRSSLYSCFQPLPSLWQRWFMWLRVWEGKWGGRGGREAGSWGEKLVYQQGLIKETHRKLLRRIFHDVAQESWH